MTRRRFFAPTDNFIADGAIIKLPHEESRHLRDVLRLGHGDEVFVFDGDGREFRCLVTEAAGNNATLTISEEVAPAQRESPLNLSLGIGLLKGDKLELVVQKATELGISTIVPVETKFADLRFRNDKDAEHRLARLQRIALEACKQSGRARIPTIEPLTDFHNFVSHAPANNLSWRVMFAERDGATLHEAVAKLPSRPTQVSALVGSEGGWSKEEVAEAREAKWEIVTLGGRTLRAETAAITATSLLQYLFGDLE